MIEREFWSGLERQSQLIRALPDDARRSARRMSVLKATRLFRQGDKPSALYFVMSGEVRLVRQSRSGNEIVLQRASRGFIAEASLDHRKYHCDGVAVLASEFLVIPRAAFLDALADDQFRAHWIRHLSQELRRVRAHAERLSLRTAKERIIHYLETEGDDGLVELPCSKKEWSCELGLSHEALYRTLAVMERTGEIAVNGLLVRLTR